MNPEAKAVEILLGIGVYKEEREAFWEEGITRLRAGLRCSKEEAERMLQDLGERKVIQLEFVPGDQQWARGGWRWKRGKS